MEPESFIAESAESKRVLQLANRVADTTINVLITGEQGVGRQTLARYIHKKSTRSSASFESVSVGASPAADLANTLFGQGTGASTRASSRTSHMALLRRADGGTLLLQNIEDMPLALQPMLLNFIQAREFLPAGARRRIRVDTRLMGTASPLLKEYVAQGRFRVDLFYRLSIYPIEIPPLRMRRDDILPLARHFIQLVSPDRHRDISVPAMERLLEYPWPGNVQELKNVITRACLLSRSSSIDANDLSLEAIRPRPAAEQLVHELTPRLQDAERQLNTLVARTIIAAPIWQGRRFATQSDLCFVLMPFSDDLDVQKVYVEYVKPTVEACALRCLRADNVYGVSGIMQSIWEAINQSRVIIADVTGRNPNVFYELGIAHTLGKPVVMMTQSMNDVPFDLKHLRCIVYDYKPRAIERFQDTLTKTLTTVLETPPTDVEA